VGQDTEENGGRGEEIGRENGERAGEEEEIE
jgi:hypothetical protein